MSKICSRCKILKENTEFSKGQGTQDLQNYCKLCSKKYNQSDKMKDYMKKYRNSDIGLKNRKNPKTIYYCLFYNAKRDKRVIEFTIKEFISWYNKQDKTCIYCHKTEREAIKDKSGKYCRLSIDRKDNKIGYTLNNIGLCCMSCNLRKSDDLSFEQMIKVAQFINKLKEK